MTKERFQELLKPIADGLFGKQRTRYGAVSYTHLELPGVLVGRDVAQGHLQGTGQGTGGNVGEQLVPDHLLDAIGNVSLEAALSEGISKLLQPGSFADNAAHVGHAAAAVLGNAQTGYAGVVLGGTCLLYTSRCV